MVAETAWSSFACAMLFGLPEPSVEAIVVIWSPHVPMLVQRLSAYRAASCLSLFSPQAVAIRASAPTTATAPRYQARRREGILYSTMDGGSPGDSGVESAGRTIGCVLSATSRPEQARDEPERREGAGCKRGARAATSTTG